MDGDRGFEERRRKQGRLARDGDERGVRKQNVRQAELRRQPHRKGVKKNHHVMHVCIEQH